MPPMPLLCVAIGGLLWFGNQVYFFLWLSLVILAIALYPSNVREGSIFVAVGKQLLVALTVTVASTLAAVGAAGTVGVKVSPDEALSLLLTLLTLSIAFSGYGFIAANFHEAYREAVRADIVKHQPVVLSAFVIALLLSLLPFLLFAE